MSNRQEKERRRGQRLAAEEAAAAKAARRNELSLIGGAIALLAVVVAVAVGVSSGGKKVTSRPQPAPTPAELAHTPRPLAANLRQANKIIDTPVQDKLAALRGVPVVVNQWASWCPNCKAEFGFFQQLSRRYQDKVAFLGLDSNDDRGSAKDFLKQFPVSYPSIYDPGAGQAASIGAGQGWPTTIFFSKTGQRTYIRPGGYTTLESLDADIQQYALNS